MATRSDMCSALVPLVGAKRDVVHDLLCEAEFPGVADHAVHLLGIGCDAGQIDGPVNHIDAEIQ